MLIYNKDDKQAYFYRGWMSSINWRFWQLKQQFWPGFLSIAKNERLLDLVMTPKGCYNSPFFLLATEAEFIWSRLVTTQNWSWFYQSVLQRVISFLLLSLNFPTKTLFYSTKISVFWTKITEGLKISKSSTLSELFKMTYWTTLKK